MFRQTLRVFYHQNKWRVYRHYSFNPEDMPNEKSFEEFFKKTNSTPEELLEWIYSILKYFRKSPTPCVESPFKETYYILDKGSVSRTEEVEYITYVGLRFRGMSVMDFWRILQVNDKYLRSFLNWYKKQFNIKEEE